MMWGKVKFRVWGTAMESKTGQRCHDLDISRMLLLTTKSFWFDPHCSADQFHTKSLIKSIFCKNAEPSGQHLPCPWRVVSPWKKLLCPDCFCHPHLMPWYSTEKAECGSKLCQSHFITTKSFSTSSFPLQTNRYCLPQALKSGGWIFPPPLSSANRFSLSSSSTHSWKMGNSWNNKGEKALKWLDPKVRQGKKGKGGSGKGPGTLHLLKPRIREKGRIQQKVSQCHGGIRRERLQRLIHPKSEKWEHCTQNLCFVCEQLPTCPDPEFS